MREVEFEQWMRANNYRTRTIGSRLSYLRRLDEVYGDLDTICHDGMVDALLFSLRYSSKDRKKRKPNPTRLEITGDLLVNLRAYRTSVRIYQRFWESEPMAPESDENCWQRVNARHTRSYLENTVLAFSPTD